MIFGVHTTDYVTAVSMGFKFNRLWDFGNEFFRNIRFEPTENGWKLDGIKEKLIAMRNAGIEPIGVIHAESKWRHPGIDSNLSNPLEYSAKLYSLDSSLFSNWQKYAWNCASRFQGLVRFWEIWDEPHAISFPSHHNYVEAVRQVEWMIRRVGGVVIAGSGHLHQHEDFANAVLKSDLYKYVDIIRFDYGYFGGKSESSDYYSYRVKTIKSLGLPVWNSATNCGRYEEPDKSAIDRWAQAQKDSGVDGVIFYYMNPVNDGHPENLANANGPKWYARYLEEKMRCLND